MDDSIGQFLHFMSVEKGASDNTIEAYRSDLSQFRTFLSTIDLDGRSPNWKKVTKNTIESYINSLRQRRYATATVARKVAVVKSFFSFLHAGGILPADPTDGLESPRVGKTFPRPLSEQQVDELLEQPARRGTSEALRDHAMLELLYATGLRVTELVSLDLDSISMNARRLYVRCLSKSAKERTVPIHKQALHILARYINDGRPRIVRNKKEQALFVNKRGERLTRQGFWLILKQYARDAGIEELVTPTTLRHSFAAHMLNGGAPLRDVKELLGHANISTTQVYTQITDDHAARQIYEQAHPLSKPDLAPA